MPYPKVPPPRGLNAFLVLLIAGIAVGVPIALIGWAIYRLIG